ncbi:MAG: DsbE family thiol:disulfide interchange protein [Parasphingorhabdus sp.]|nr:DsbE family thiol:disulfide interchange protein [Parasphingorhabdus sp.]
MMNNRWRLWLPLALFAVFFAVAAGGLLTPKDEIIQSRMIGKPMPQFALPPAIPEMPGLGSANLNTGKPQLVNIFASWCLPCAVEAPQLAALQRAGAIINGIAIRDTPQDVSRFLKRHGNPFARIGADRTSSVQLDLGSSGVPETFVVDGKGRILYQHIGDIRAADVPKLLKILQDAQ